MSDTAIRRGKIFFAIGFQSEASQSAMTEALQSLGWEVEEFSWWDYIPESFWGKVQNKYLFGPLVKRINEALIERCSSLKPDVVFIHRGVYVWPQTIVQMKHCAHLVVSWNTDDPFGNYDLDFAKRYRVKGNILLSKIVPYEKAFYFKRLWANFIRTIPLYDICFVIRRKNIEKYQSVGAREVHLMRCFYVPEQDHPIKLTADEQKRLGSDVVFIGHFEPDHRTECLEALLEVGIHVRLFGTRWDHYLSRKLRKAFGTSIRPLFGDEYVKALCASKIALCFFSKLNNSTHTTRSFEIPACGSLLLSERTDEMRELFEEDKETVYFSDKEELVRKVEFLLDEPERRRAIAQAGHSRCIADGHDVVSRMRKWDEIVRTRLDGV